jgi:cytochrome c-type biogenesis protein CcmE
MLPRHRRFIGLVTIIIGVALASFFILNSFQKNLLYYLTPIQVELGEAPDNKEFRMGGLVLPGSFNREEGSLIAEFTLTDGEAAIKVFYSGILPDLFREGQGIIVKGKLDERGYIIASEVLAKHDENYMPPNIKPLDQMKEGS